MYVRAVVAGFAVGLLFALVAWSAPQLHYLVTIDPTDEFIRIEGEVTDLQTRRFDLVLDDLAWGLAEHFHEMQVKGGTLSGAGDGHWSVARTADTVGFTYAVEKVVPANPGGLPWAKPNDIAVFSDDLCAVIIAPYLFVYPDLSDFERISVAFDVPDEWTIVCPHPLMGDEHVVIERVGDPIADFLCDQEIYMGVMEYYVEVPTRNSVVKFGKLQADDYDVELRTQAEVDEYAQVAAVSLARWAEFFGEDPPPVYVLVANFKRDHEGEWLKWRTTSGLNGMQYWNPHRWDEFLGHGYQSWVNFYPPSPLVADIGITKGILEDYYSHKLAWELFGDSVYLAKRYLYYLMYEWMHDHHDRPIGSYTIPWADEYDAYIRWEFIGLLLDKEIEQRSGGEQSLEDAIRWLYGRYAGTGVQVTAAHLQRAIEEATGVRISDVFSRYVYWDTKLPVYPYVAQHREHFISQTPLLESAHGHNYMHGHVAPWFINIVMAAALGEHLPHALLDLEYAVDIAEIILADYSLDHLTEADVVDVLSNQSGVDCSRFFTHWENSFGRLSFGDLVEWLKDYSKAGNEAANVAIQSPRYSDSGRGEMWGDATAGDITWAGTLVDSVPVELTVVVVDPELVSDSSPSEPAVTFGVEFNAEDGWGHAIVGVGQDDKIVFSHQYDGDPPLVKYFEKVTLPLEQVGESRWEATVRVIPRTSITRFTVGQGNAAFGVNVRVASDE